MQDLSYSEEARSVDATDTAPTLRRSKRNQRPPDRYTAEDYRYKDNARLNGHRADMTKRLPEVVTVQFNTAVHNFDELKLYILQSHFYSPRDRKYRYVYPIHSMQRMLTPQVPR